MKKIKIFTDGSCLRNPGPGGWAAILRYGEAERELVGAEADTTNNRMELRAVIEAFRALREPCEVELFSDSRYVLQSLQSGWAASWQRRGWRKADGKPALNPDLWGELLSLLAPHAVHLNWIRGHDGHPENERCDALAVAAARKLQNALEKSTD